MNSRARWGEAHSCRNRHCFNPRHLSWKTRAENESDKLRDGTHIRGERHPLSKLTEQQVNEIRRRYDSGRITQRELADEYGVHQMTVSRVVRRDRWGWLDNRLELSA